MKKLIILLTVLVLVFSLASCYKEDKPVSQENTVSGLITSDGYHVFVDTNIAYRQFKILCEDGREYLFFIREFTELIWEDTSAFDYRNTDASPWDVFDVALYVDVVYNIYSARTDDYVDGWYDALKITVTGVGEDYPSDYGTSAKPVIYLYPEEETEVEVTLDYDGVLTCTYPNYNDGWFVTASPDGTLRDENGQEYNYLYWEGITDTEFDFSKGFCVKGEDTAQFLEYALEMLGLTRREANEFIVYWLPLMEQNPYNIISFQTDAYTDNAVLTVTPTPDTVLRVYMAWQALDAPIDIEPQELASTERVGFTVVEWGGTEVK